ncbi:MAG: ABC transporter ATP-binding protein, partial [Spirochaetaceae bacterium]|nr:ABC transporter ATP-binding protein [Spirochaetaceae bacterium]
MGDYFETEEVVKEYDSTITLRILSYLKPYKFLTIVALTALAFSTLGELAVPVLQQRLIDRAVISRYLPLVLNGRAPEDFSGLLGTEAFTALKKLVLVRGALEAGPYLFIPRDEKIRLSGREEKALRSAGILAGGQWYACTVVHGSALEAVVER